MTTAFQASAFQNDAWQIGVAVGGGGSGGGVSVDWSRYRVVSPQQPPPQHFTVLSSGTQISWRVRSKGGGTVVHPELVPVRVRRTVASSGTRIAIRFAVLGRGAVEVNEEDDELALLGVL